MSVFKRLPGGSHILEPFEVNATQSFSWVSGSSDFDGFSINLANQPLNNYPVGTLDLGGTTDGGFNSYPLYRSVEKYFFVGDPYEFSPSGSMFVWSIGSNYMGEGIKPRSFRVDLTGVSTYLQDDGRQNIRLNGTGSIVGTIFYQHGIVAVQRNITASADHISSDGISIQNAGQVDTTFLSVVDIYEHTVNCVLNPNDFRYTMNPSNFVTGSNGQKYNDLILSGSQTPYITSIGLYNDLNELVAVGKLSRPITRMEWTDQTFVIKFDE